MIYLDIATLPSKVQNAIAHGENICFLQNGKPINQQETQIDYDINSMNHALNAKSAIMPTHALQDVASFEQWLSGAFK
ncbi:hypothetical protein [Lonepinella sp. BR2271]|uniref:hypothetical protein n=1 Tax=Lonepinella sp. BR2271 TaxID=3434550 RepID=UPI003F6E0A2A